MKKQEANPKKQSSANHHPSYDHIAVRAYEIYLARGAEPGRDVDDWLEAERQLNTTR